MEDLKIQGVQLATSNMDGGKRIIFMSENPVYIGDYFTTVYEDKIIKFKASIVSALIEPELYAVTASFKTRMNYERTVDIRKFINLPLIKADEETQKKFEASEGFC